MKGIIRRDGEINNDDVDVIDLTRQVYVVELVEGFFIWW